MNSSPPTSISARALAAGPPPRGKARAHSRMVKVLRLVLPMAMVGIVAGLVGLVGAHAIERQAAARHEGAPIRMVNPHFYGRDARNRPYTLGASEAARGDQSFQKVLLRNPSVTLDVDGIHPSTLTADSGVYQEDTRILDLKGHVRGSDAKTSHFATDEAIVNTRTGSVTGAGPVSSQTSQGDVKSNAFDAYDKGDRVVFKGGVHARLNQH